MVPGSRSPGGWKFFTLTIPKDLDVLHPHFASPDLTMFCRLDELDLVAVGQLIEPDRATIECRPVATDPWCRRCGAEGAPRDTVTRRLAHEPFGHRPTTLLVRVRRYLCERRAQPPGRRAGHPLASNS